MRTKHILSFFAIVVFSINCHRGEVGRGTFQQDQVPGQKTESPHDSQVGSKPHNESNVVIVDRDVVNMRESPTTGSRILRKLVRGHELALLGTEGNWSEVKAPDGLTGYIRSDLVTAQESDYSTFEKTDDSTKNTFISRGANVRLLPDGTSEIVFVLPPDSLFETDVNKGNWLHGKAADGKEGWIHNSRLISISSCGTLQSGPSTNPDTWTISEKTSSPSTARDTNTTSGTVSDSRKTLGQVSTETKTISHKPKSSTPNDRNLFSRTLSTLDMARKRDADLQPPYSIYQVYWYSELTSVLFHQASRDMIHAQHQLIIAILSPEEYCKIAFQFDELDSFHARNSGDHRTDFSQDWKTIEEFSIDEEAYHKEMKQYRKIYVDVMESAIKAMKIENEAVKNNLDITEKSKTRNKHIIAALSEFEPGMGNLLRAKNETLSVLDLSSNVKDRGINLTATFRIKKKMNDFVSDIEENVSITREIMNLTKEYLSCYGYKITLNEQDGQVTIVSRPV